jgi:hypothetical protein
LKPYSGMEVAWKRRLEDEEDVEDNVKSKKDFLLGAAACLIN